MTRNTVSLEEPLISPQHIDTVFLETVVAWIAPSGTDLPVQVYLVFVQFFTVAVLILVFIHFLCTSGRS